MESVILIIHLIIVVSLVFVILLQRSSQDGLAGLGGGGNSAGGVQVRGSANLLTKMTSFLAVGFIMTSLGLAYLANQAGESLIEKIAAEEAAKPAIVEPEVPLAE